MANSFLNESKEVANHFIKNILFVDDEIVWKDVEVGNNTEHELNAKALIKDFAKVGKSCTFYNIEKQENYKIDRDNIIRITRNSDVIILDWKTTHDSKIILAEVEEAVAITVVEAAVEVEEAAEVEEDVVETVVEVADEIEEDVVESEGRGLFTLTLLEQLINNFSNSLKLIIILTGETIGSDILNAIESRNNKTIFQKDEANLSLLLDKIKISIYFKPDIQGGSGNNSHLSDEVKNKIVSYQNLPDIIDTEFASFTGGLIPNTALKAISTIRDNASKLLKVYKKELDPAYLAHRALLTVPENSEDLLKDTILHSISNLISTNHISDKCDNESIEKWLVANEPFDINETTIGRRHINLTPSNNRMKLVEKGYSTGMKELFAEQHSTETMSNSAINNLDKEKNTIIFFMGSDESTANINEEFAILTHHKDYFDDNFAPILTLGSVIRKVVEGDNKYFICIQPLCDTVRIDETNNHFVFIPLNIAKKEKAKVIAKEEDVFILLEPIHKANSLKTITFKIVNDKDFIQSVNNKFIAIEKIIIRNSETNKEEIEEQEIEYEWVLDLKDNHAQRIANEFAASISRVGLDESEWLRRS